MRFDAEPVRILCRLPTSLCHPGLACVRMLPNPSDLKHAATNGPRDYRASLPQSNWNWLADRGYALAPSCMSIRVNRQGYRHRRLRRGVRPQRCGGRNRLNGKYHLAPFASLIPSADPVSCRRRDTEQACRYPVPRNLYADYCIIFVFIAINYRQ